MGFPALLKAIQGLNTSTEALAAVGAMLNARLAGAGMDPRVAASLDRIAAGIEPGLLDGLDDAQAANALAFIKAFFRQAHDLLDNPGRAPGWVYEDPVILQAQGQASRLIARVFEAFAARNADFEPVLKQPAALLDVGTGVGWFAIEAARTWPAMRVVGIDVWDPALDLARANLAGSGHAERVELRRQSVADVEDREAFDLIWLAGPFIPADVVRQSIPSLFRALKPGGWLMFGLYNPGPTPLGQALSGLRIIRGGGHPWTTDEAQALLAGNGLAGNEVFVSDTPVMLVAGRKEGA